LPFTVADSDVVATPQKEQELLMHARRHRSVLVGFALAIALGLSSAARADEHLKGVISDRGSDGSVTIQTDDGSTFVVVLGDTTKVRRTDGIRETKASATDLIPGLRINAAGEFEAVSRLAATKITFTRADLKTALDIQGGVTTTDKRTLANQQAIQQHAQLLKQQQETLARQAQQIASNNAAIKANDAKMIATTGALANRISNLDDYDVIKSVTVYFANGRASIPSKYKSDLQQVAADAKGMPSYVIQVQGYASAVGPDKLNQRLSQARADAVTAVLQQEGVPLTNVVVPAAMGTTGQVASNKTAKGQAENRRTVVTLLRSKGVTENK
jgi:outer membrane protein OmpA-like peptidoglycan-associated protein